jgi:hypothetical protein
MATIAVDFDATIVKDAWPAIGEDAGALKWLIKWQEEGHTLILNTLRKGKQLQDAAEYLTNNGVYPVVVWRPAHHKVPSDFIIDDRSIGVPLTKDPETGRPYVDWDAVGPMTEARIAMQEKS